MYYLKDKTTGNKIEITVQKILLLKVSFISSFVLYGLVMSIALSFIGLSYGISLMILAGLYLIELYSWFSNNYSPGKILFTILLFVMWKPIFDEILSAGDNQKANWGEAANDLLSSYNFITGNKHRYSIV